MYSTVQIISNHIVSCQIMSHIYVYIYTHMYAHTGKHMRDDDTSAIGHQLQISPHISAGSRQLRRPRWRDVPGAEV